MTMMALEVRKMVVDKIRGQEAASLLKQLNPRVFHYEQGAIGFGVPHDLYDENEIVMPAETEIKIPGVYINYEYGCGQRFMGIGDMNIVVDHVVKFFETNWHIEFYDLTIVHMG